MAQVDAVGHILCPGGYHEAAQRRVGIVAAGYSVCVDGLAAGEVAGVDREVRAVGLLGEELPVSRGGGGAFLYVVKLDRCVGFDLHLHYLGVEMCGGGCLGVVAQQHPDPGAGHGVDQYAPGRQQGNVGVEYVDYLDGLFYLYAFLHPYIYAVVEQQAVDKGGGVAVAYARFEHRGRVGGELLGNGAYASGIKPFGGVAVEVLGGVEHVVCHHGEQAVELGYSASERCGKVGLHGQVAEVHTVVRGENVAVGVACDCCKSVGSVSVQRLRHACGCRRVLAPQLQVLRESVGITVHCRPPV